MTVVEIVAQSPRDARVAIGNGADRVELCQALITGGITASHAVMAGAVDAVGGDRVAALIRPRAGGYIYDGDEIRVVAADIRNAVALGIGAVVVGALRPDLSVDANAVERWREAAGDADLVFHRAIDVHPDPVAAVSELVHLGATRILTSGGATRAGDGTAVLAEMVGAANGRLQIQAGGGVTIDAIAALRAAGVDAIHLSARVAVSDGSPAGPGGGIDEYDVVSDTLVRAARAAADA
ncbi:copper homeostasis protein CutC [Microbacterium sp. ZW T5_56]|uniref:copper homeostasis protein CutC n=1 Tax=Microbacterium sp. ZW T5_56 TaxID=3378081 RepID=UPI003851C09B